MNDLELTISILRERLDGAENKNEALEAENERLHDKLLQTQARALVYTSDAIQGFDSVLNDREEG